MAYIGYEFMYDGTRATFWGYIQTAMINFGWELHDSISATVKVYKSNGESGKEPYGYVWIDAGTSTYIQFAFYQYWNSTTHAGVRLRYPGAAASYSQLTSSYWQSTQPGSIIGDKDIIVVCSNVYNPTIGSAVAFGHLPFRFDSNLTAAQGTAGTAGTITIASSSGMGDGKRIQIAGAEGCDSLVISASPDATTRILASLPRTYASGAVAGAPASTFGSNYAGSYLWYPVSSWGDAGTTVGTLTYTVANLTGPAFSANLQYNEGVYFLVPIYVYNLSASSPGAIYGGFGNNILGGITITANYLDAAGVNDDGSFSQVNILTGVGSNTISDSSRSWTVNAHAGKLCCISNGQGNGIIKLISSNTSDTLTLDSNWPALYYPSGGSEFKIYDKIYRGYTQILSGACWVRVTKTAVPS